MIAEPVDRAFRIEVQRVPACPVCGDKGAIRYTELRDRLFAAPGTWVMKQCRHPRCRHLWLDPRPADESIPALYDRYHTHSAPAESADEMGADVRRIARRAILREAFGYGEAFPRERVGIAARLLAGSEHYVRRVGRTVMWLRWVPGGRLLDFGCGDGRLARRMRRLGWQVTGYDPDHRAAALVSTNGIEALSDLRALYALPRHSFDAITMSHVIEHLADPVAELVRLRGLLRPAGTLVISTPNAGSHGHRLFKQDWRGLEPPRHLSVFTPGSLRRALSNAGLAERELFGLAMTARPMWRASRELRRARVDSMSEARVDPKPPRLAPALLELLESMAPAATPVGEELVAIASPQEVRPS